MLLLVPHLQLKDVRGQLSQTVVGEVDLLQVSLPEDGDAIWKSLDFIAGRFALPLRGGGETMLPHVSVESPE